MKITRKAFILFMAICGFIQQQTFGQQADFVLTGGKIFTSESSRLYVEAFAIKGNKVNAIGKNAEIEKLEISDRNIKTEEPVTSLVKMKIK